MSPARKFRPAWWISAFAAAALVVAAATAPAADSKSGTPFLWKIEGGKVPSWIFGTIHLARPDVTALPPAVADALARADAVHTEIPMDPATMLSVMPRLLLPAGATLEGILGAKLTADLKSEYARGGKAAGYIERLRPWAAAVSLIELDDQAKYPGTLPLDLVLYQRAAMSGKIVGGLETPDKQLAIFDDLSNEEQVALVEDTLSQIRGYRARGENLSDSLAALYLAGDLDTLVAELNKLDAGTHPALREKLMERLLYRRNVLMAERIVKILRDHPARSDFFAVGAAHLQGDGGLLALLEKAGFRLERVQLSSQPSINSQLP